MPMIPRDSAFDSTLFIPLEGYNFIWNRCRKLDSDVFATRVLGKKTICIHGPDAAALFYDESKLARAHALPRRVVTSLFGKHAIHTLDDAEHKARKAAFLSLMSEQSLERLMVEMSGSWKRALERWPQQDEVLLMDEAQRVLVEAVCQWAGVPRSALRADKRAKDLARMVDGFGGIGPRLWKAKLARTRSEAWIARLVHQVRTGKLQAPADSALYVMANYRDLGGDRLDLRTAAVEVLNVLRPTVAIAWYVVFAAHALHRHPAARERIQHEAAGQHAGSYTDAFMQEVRRYYPFTPYLGARTRTSFTWNGYEFPRAALVLLDVYGTEHDPRVWANADQFRPERFLSWNGGEFDLIPQGGGSHRHGHRCPGEWLTMHSIALALHYLTRCCTYNVVSDQDLTIDLGRMPTQPASGFVLRDVRTTEALARPAPLVPSESATRGRTAPQSSPTVRAVH